MAQEKEQRSIHQSKSTSRNYCKSHSKNLVRDLSEIAPLNQTNKSSLKKKVHNSSSKKEGNKLTNAKAKLYPYATIIYTKRNLRSAMDAQMTIQSWPHIFFPAICHTTLIDKQKNTNT